jgi:hypothetical protein
MSETSGEKPGRGLVELIGKALTDKDLRSELFKDPDAAAKRFSLSGQDVDAIKKLDKAKFEVAASQLAGRSDLTIKVQITKHF